MELTRRSFLAVTGAAVTAACGDQPRLVPADPVDAAAVDRTDASELQPPGDVFEKPLDAPADPADAPYASLDAPIAPDAPDAPDAPIAPDDVTTADADPLPEDVSTDAGTDDFTRMIPERRAAFPLGMMAGDMNADSAALWTRLVGAGSLVVRVERMVRGRPVETVIEREVPAGAAGFTQLVAEGLTPGARYRATFLLRERGAVVARSSFSHFRAALAEGSLEAVTLGATACTNALYRPFAPLQRVGEHDELDFFVHLGDMAYCDGARSAEEFREKYSQNFASEGFRRVFERAGLYSTWDDHELDNNWNPERVSASLLATARAAFFEHRAVRRDPLAPDRIWRSARWGATLELFILDCRSERRPSTRTSSTAEYLSRAQMNWLKAGLASSPARFKLIANSVPIANLPVTFGAGEDRWEGYAAARNEVLDHITSQRIRGVWWLSGDIHLGAVAKLEAGGPRSAMRDLIVGPGGQFPNPLFLTLTPGQFDFSTGENNYAIIRADPARDELTIRFINGAGRVIFERSFANA